MLNIQNDTVGQALPPANPHPCATVVKRMLSDLRHAIRAIFRSPVFALSTILTLALGAGANTGAFSALNTLLLRPLPYPRLPRNGA